MPEYTTNYKGLENYSKKEFAMFFYKLLDDCMFDDVEWNSFEDSLAKLKWEDIFDDAYEIYDKDGDLDTFNAYNNYTDISKSLSESVHIIKTLFSDWMHEIDTTCETMAKIKDILKDNPLCISFNYTDTIERNYGYSNVFHIHGYVHDYNVLIVGHGENEYIVDEELDEKYYGAINEFKNTFNILKKDTSLIIKNNYDFFKNIEFIDSIYIFGQSINKIDAPYYYKIKSVVKENIPIFIATKDDDSFENSKNALKEIGFLGQIEKW